MVAQRRDQFEIRAQLKYEKLNAPNGLAYGSGKAALRVLRGLVSFHSNELRRMILLFIISTIYTDGLAKIKKKNKTIINERHGQRNSFKIFLCFSNQSLLNVAIRKVRPVKVCRAFIKDRARPGLAIQPPGFTPSGRLRKKCEDNNNNKKEKTS